MQKMLPQVPRMLIGSRNIPRTRVSGGGAENSADTFVLFSPIRLTFLKMIFRQVNFGIVLSLFESCNFSN